MLLTDNWITMSIDDIPYWLHDSLFFETLLERQDEFEIDIPFGRPAVDNQYDKKNYSFEIDSKLIKQDCSIKNLNDFIDIARIIDYWQLNFIPESMLYAVQNDIVSYDEFLCVKRLYPWIWSFYNSCPVSWSALEVFSSKVINNFKEAFDAVYYWNQALKNEVPQFIIELEDYLKYTINMI